MTATLAVAAFENPGVLGVADAPEGLVEGGRRALEEETGVRVSQEDIELFDTAFAPIEG